eukprot:394544-Hanusia_phi.AAC.1
MEFRGEGEERGGEGEQTERERRITQAQVAFGTDDGRVGMCDVMSQKHRELAGRHSGSVYELGWWSLGCEDRAWMLCSCGADGKILCRRSEWGGEEMSQGGCVDLAKRLGGGEGSQAKVSDFHLSRNGTRKRGRQEDNK